ncbi:MAG: selenocysteine-specific translation elongation factor [Vicinamibacterales bacterium]
MTRTIVVGTAGHIDHGKSALVKALTGTDPDRLKEEKARGITIELGFAHGTVAEDIVVSFVDVPGHERFVRAMLAGVGGIDLVMLVVAADESVMPQTREHFDICRLLDVARGLVVVTKTDAVEPGMVDLVAAEVQELVAGSFLDGAPIVPVSALTGDGLPALRHALAAIARALPPRPTDGVTRLPVDRAFTMKGFGTVVTGTLVGGRITVDEELQLLPAARRVKVRGLHVHGGARSDAQSGERVAANLAGIDVGEVDRGSVLTTPFALPVTRRADVRVTMLPGLSLKHGARVRVHQGTAEVLARAAVSGTAAAVEAGGTADVRLRFESSTVLTRGDRVILRSYSPPVTIGGGRVLDPLPPRAGVRTARGVARMDALASVAPADLAAAARVMIDAAGPAGLSVRDVAPRLGAPYDTVSTAVDGLVASGTAVRGGDWVVGESSLREPRASVLEGLAAFHRTQPLAPGVGLEEARARWFRLVPPAVVDVVVGTLVGEGRIVATDTLALSSHRVALSPEDAVLQDWLDRRFREAGLAPPDVSALPGESGRPSVAVERVLALMVKGRRLIRVDTLVFHPATLDALKADVVARKASAPNGRATVDVKAFKDAYNVTRKYAIPLLEYLDRERVTRRQGDARIVL